MQILLATPIGLVNVIGGSKWTFGISQMLQEACRLKIIKRTRVYSCYFDTVLDASWTLYICFALENIRNFEQKYHLVFTLFTDTLGHPEAIVSPYYTSTHKWDISPKNNRL